MMSARLWFGWVWRILPDFQSFLNLLYYSLLEQVMPVVVVLCRGANPRLCLSLGNRTERVCKSLTGHRKAEAQSQRDGPIKDLLAVGKEITTKHTLVE